VQNKAVFQGSAIPKVPKPVHVHDEGIGNMTLTVSSEEIEAPQVKKKIQHKGGGQIGGTGVSKKGLDWKTKNAVVVEAGSNPYTTRKPPNYD
jgi:hypothetical protein